MGNLPQENQALDHIPSSYIGNAINQAIDLAASNNRIVTFDFKGVIVSVNADSDPALIHRDWSRAFDGCIDKHIGPHPNPEFTDEDRTRDELHMEERLHSLGLTFIGEK